jgi:SAM-dependent methyltransferase
VNGYGEDLASIHDEGFSELAALAAARVLDLLRDNGIDSGLIVELGCGGGVSARRFVVAGYQVLGIDNSPAMIEIARQRVPAARFRTGSFLDAPLPTCAAITAIGEVLNYRLDPDLDDAALPALYRRAYDALQPGGLFIFDLAGPGRVPGGGPVRYWSAGADWAVLAESEEDAARRLLTRRITTFRDAGDGYRRGEEVHIQRLYPPAEVLADLGAAGFFARDMPGYGFGRFAPGHNVFIAERSPS